MDDIAIRVEGLAKSYVIGHAANREAYTSLREKVADLASGLLRSVGDMVRGKPLVAGDRTEEFWALRDVSFEVRRGEVLGIIGKNGAGKSTLLKILSRITDPTAGFVELNGRVASLLEVGTGFHPELTGRENIYLNGAILGMTRAEIRSKFDEIVAFAGVERFLDTPVKRYSSGMYVRLAFAVAAHLQPQILIVDEVLAVGDAEFQARCLRKMDEVTKSGRTVLFVSHNLAAVRKLCSRVALLSEGRLEALGATERVIKQYLAPGTRDSGTLVGAGRRVSTAIEVVAVTIDGSPAREHVIAPGMRRLAIEIKGRLGEAARLAVELQLYDASLNPVGFFAPGHFSSHAPLLRPGPFALTAELELPDLACGDYPFALSIVEPGRESYWEMPVGPRIEAVGRASIATGTTTQIATHGPIVLDGRQTSSAGADQEDGACLMPAHQA